MKNVVAKFTLVFTLIAGGINVATAEVTFPRGDLAPVSHTHNADSSQTINFEKPAEFGRGDLKSEKAVGLQSSNKSQQAPFYSRGDI
ncbi:hypothetical protein ACPV4B_13905 [Vibrio parahaemolyticus]